jgi:hypothetical protein
MKTLAAVSISADDLLDAARTIPLGDISTCGWLIGWVPASTFLEWAKQGLAHPDAFGLSNAVTYAKRSAACRIDLLLQYNHLVPFWRSTYPAKIVALRQVGVSIPDVVHELAIDPRNALEHNYRLPSQDVARHAVGVAELFLRATDAEYERSSIVAVAWNVMGSQLLASGQEYVNFREFGDRPMLFVDVFDEPHSARIVDPENGETRSAPLSSFSEDQSLALAGILRANYSHGSLFGRGASRSYFQEMKRQGGF